MEEDEEPVPAAPGPMRRELLSLVSQDLDWIWLKESGPPDLATRRVRQLKRSFRFAADQIRLYLPKPRRRRPE